MALRLIVLHRHRSFLGQSWTEVYCLSKRELGDVNWEFVVNCEVYEVLNLPDCPTVQLGLKFKKKKTPRT